MTLSPAKAAALQEIQAAIGAAREAQKKGDFAAYGAALQRLDDAITKFNNTNSQGRCPFQTGAVTRRPLRNLSR